MSRTNKGSKGCGYEYWGRRPGKSTVPGKDTKRFTHRIERQEGKQEATRCAHCGALLPFDSSKCCCLVQEEYNAP